MFYKGWRAQTIGNLIVSADSGISLLGEDISAEAGEPAILTLSSISNGLFKPDQYKVVSILEKDKLSVSPKCDRILISRSNTPSLVGAAVYVDRDYPDRFLPDLIWQLEPSIKEDFSMRWLCYWLQSGIGRGFIRKIASGSSQSMVKINKNAFFKIALMVPSLPEQHKIAEIISVWDHAIDLTTQLIAAKQRRKQGLMQQLLTGKKRFSAFHQQWLETSFGQIFFAKSVKNTGSRIKRPITVGKYAIRPQNEHFSRVIASDNLENYNIIEKGDFVYDPMSAYYGAFGRYELDEPGIVSPVYRVLGINSDYASDFVKHFIKSHYITFQLSANSSQGNREGKRRTIQAEAFDSISVKVPKIDEQHAIAKVFNTCDQELTLLNNKLSLLKKQKQGLMQQLLTGRIRVNI
jgi:type I restriction enzyme, S subunit